MKCKNCSIYVEWDVICGECKSEEKSQDKVRVPILPKGKKDTF